jgi:hypothetical protein
MSPGSVQFIGAVVAELHSGHVLHDMQIVEFACRVRQVAIPPGSIVDPSSQGVYIGWTGIED